MLALGLGMMEVSSGMYGAVNDDASIATIHMEILPAFRCSSGRTLGIPHTGNSPCSRLIPMQVKSEAGSQAEELEARYVRT